jgi:hypothetical protein
MRRLINGLAVGTALMFLAVGLGHGDPSRSGSLLDPDTEVTRCVVLLDGSSPDFEALDEVQFFGWLPAEDAARRH